MTDKADGQLQSLRIDREQKHGARRGGWGKYLIAAVCVAALVIAVQMRRGAADSGNPSAPASETPAGTTATEELADGVILTASGYITPRERVSLSPEVIGRVVWVQVDKGEKVTSGQILVKLDDRDYRARERQAEQNLAAARARLAELEAGSRPEEIERTRAEAAEAQATFANAQRVLKRRKALQVQGGVIAEEDVESTVVQEEVASARLAAAKARLAELVAGPRKERIEAARAELLSAEASAEEAHLAVEDTVIRAPRDGTILEKLIEVGELVSPQNFGGTRGARTELLSLADLTDLQVEVDISESDFAKVSMGQAAKVYLDAYPDKAYDGTIREIAPEANRQKATVQVKVKVLNPDQLVLPEMSARVDLLKP